MSLPTYNRAIRKIVIGFGNLFNNITLVRYNPDQTEAERVLVPIVYATKELYVRRLEDDPALDKKLQTALPRMSFEMSGFTYDVSRKLNTNHKTFAKTSGGIVSQYNPVPYNFDFDLYLYVRNIEDGTQIIEHILPFFAPDYTIKLNMVAELGIVKEIPVILNSATHDIVYEGDKTSETRMIIWTLNFTVKGFIFGKVSDTGLIRTSITNILNEISSTDTVVFNMSNPGVGTYQTGEVVYQGYSASTSSASAKVISWSNNILHLTNINGNFISSMPIIGTVSNANYVFTDYNITSQKPVNLAEVIVLPNIITNINDVTVSTQSPSLTTPYSYYFNGTNYLQIPSYTGFAFGTSDFTIECWVKVVTHTYSTGLFEIGDLLATWDDSYNSWNFQFQGEDYTVRPMDGVTENQWQHIAYVRRNGVSTVYYNGVSVASAADTNVYTSGYGSACYVGGRVAEGYTTDHDAFNGYISNFRVVKGTAVYTGNFTPPTDVLQNISGTTLLTAASDKIINEADIVDTPSNYSYTTTITEFPNIPNIS